jgi:tetratricopeptide (TPR) repeat protein
LRSLRRYATALAHLQEALALAKALADPRAEGYILNALGNISHEVGDYEVAKDCYQQAVQLRRTIHDRRGEGWSLHYLGRMHLDLEEPDAARAYQEQALTLAEETGDEELQACTRIALSAIHGQRGNREAVDLALRHAQDAVELARAKGFRQERIAALAHQAMAFLLLGDVDRALGCSEEAVQLLEQEPEPMGERERIWLYHARILRACGQEELSAHYVQRAHERAMERLAAVGDARLHESLLRAGILREILAETTGGSHDATLSG